MRKIRTMLMGIVLIALIISIGFGMWLFNLGDEPVSISGNVSVEETDDTGFTEIVKPSLRGFKDYSLSFKFLDDKYYLDSAKGISFLPSIKIKIEEYDRLLENERLWIKFEFDTSSVQTNLFAESLSSTSGFIYLDSIKRCETIDGELVLLEESDEYYDNDWHILPTHDDEGNIVSKLVDSIETYLIEEEYELIFKFRTTDLESVDHKPKTVDEYKDFIHIVSSTTILPKLKIRVVKGNELGPNLS